MIEIVCDDDILGGDPRIEGTRIGVLDVYELSVGGGYEPADAADQLDLSLAEVYAALSYYYDNPDEMRQIRAEREAAKERLAEEALGPPESVK